MERDGARLTGKRKVAALMIALGAERASPLLKSLSQAEIEEVTREIVRIEQLPQALKDEVLRQAVEDTAGRGSVTEGGADFARDLLGRTLPSQKASELLSRATSGHRQRPFGWIAELDPMQVAATLETEHPQTVALVLSNLPHDVSGRILVALSPDSRADITARLATIARTDPARVRDVETALRKKLSILEQGGLRRAGGVEAIVGILNSMDSRSERAILDALADQNPELAAQVREQMFVFEDLVRLDDRSLRRLLQDVRKELPIALRTASEELKQRIYANVSARTRDEVIRDMQTRGPARVKDIEESQQRIVDTAKALAEKEEILISRGREDVLI